MTSNLKSPLTKPEFENKSLVFITLISFVLVLIISFVGRFAFEPISFGQLLCYQLGDSCGIVGAVCAARYTGLRGEHVAASAFILLGITHGISLASSGLDQFNVERGLAVIFPMVPTFLLIGWCSLFPFWLRLVPIIPLVFLLYMYVDVVRGGEYYSTVAKLGYLFWMLTEIMWALYLLRDWKRTKQS
jgi:hypothetical protein